MESRIKTLSLLGYLGMMAGFLGLLLMRKLLSAAPVVISVQAAALGLFLWARFTLGRRSFHLAADPTEGGLVTSGPYRYIRHPIYSALCLFVWVGVLAHLSWLTALCGGLVLGCALVRIFCEETLVAARYPEYREYAARTWRMVPFAF